MAKITSIMVKCKSRVIFTVEALILVHVFKNDNFSSNGSRIVLYGAAILTLLLH
jgi:hypothetical protein